MQYNVKSQQKSELLTQTLSAKANDTKLDLQICLKFVNVFIFYCFNNIALFSSNINIKIVSYKNYIFVYQYLSSPLITAVSFQNCNFFTFINFLDLLNYLVILYYHIHFYVVSRVRFDAASLGVQTLTLARVCITNNLFI